MPVVLRCGLPRPAELTPTSALLEVNGVRWLTLTDGALVTSIAVDRPVYVAFTAPVGVGSGPLQAVSDAVRTTLPAQPSRCAASCGRGVTGLTLRRPFVSR